MKIFSLTLRRLFVFLPIFLLVLSSHADNSATSYSDNNKYFYYSDGHTFFMDISVQRVALKFRENGMDKFSKSAPSLIDVASGRFISGTDIALFNFKSNLSRADAESLMQIFMIDPTVDFVPLIFVKGRTEMIVTDEFIVQFSPAFEHNDITLLCEQNHVEAVKKINGQENTFILKTIGRNALETANKFHLMKDVIYSHPNFLRINHDPARTIKTNFDERVVWGPDGQRYFGDKASLKGSTAAYRCIEPMQLTKPDDISNTFSGPLADVLRNHIKQETFEGSFPNNWNLWGMPDTWGRTGHKKYDGSFSGYCVGGSVNAPGPYPNDTVSWMYYGPFSFAGVADARANLQAWIKTEPLNDGLLVAVSVDDYNYSGFSFSGDWSENGWINISLDMKNIPGLGDLRGQPQVWFALIFYSDEAVNYEGVYIDNIVIETIGGNYTNLTSDAYDHLQWSLNNTQQSWGVSGADIKAVDAWAISHGDSSTLIAIIDEGVDLAHPDLSSKMVPGYDATGSGSNGAPSGNDAHGTNCAGIAAAITDNSIGVAGIARLAKIMPIRIAKDDGSGNWLTSDAWIADGINWAVSHGADVLSNSWGGGSPSTVVTNAINNAKSAGRNGKGCVVVFASGNDNGAVSYPASLSTVMAVGALSPCDERKSHSSCDGEYWWGSNYGNELDITAPGVLMYSTDISGTAGYSAGDYCHNFNGTSSACPVVAGVAGLLIGKCPDLTALEVENILKQTADDLGAIGWDPHFGYGRVNAKKALQHNCGPTPPPPPPPPGDGSVMPSLMLLLD